VEAEVKKTDLNPAAVAVRPDPAAERYRQERAAHWD